MSVVVSEVGAVSCTVTTALAVFVCVAQPDGDLIPKFLLLASTKRIPYLARWLRMNIRYLSLRPELCIGERSDDRSI